MGLSKGKIKVINTVSKKTLRDIVVVKWQSIIHWDVGSIPTTDGMEVFRSSKFSFVSAKGSNGIYTSRPSI